MNKRGIAFYLDRMNVETLHRLGATDDVIHTLLDARVVPNFDEFLGSSKYEYLADEELQVRALAAKQPENAAFHIVLFQILTTEGNLVESIEEARKAVRIDPNAASAHIALALALFNDKKADAKL